MVSLKKVIFTTWQQLLQASKDKLLIKEVAEVDGE